MSIKPYFYLIYRKGVKSTSRLTRYLNACKGYLYLKPVHEPSPYKSHKKENSLSRNWEDRDNFLGKTVTIITANGTFETPTKDTPQKELLASESLFALREEWFSIHEFSADILISDKKYKYLRSKYKNSFYLFNDQLDYGIAHYFADSETTKGNMNKFLTDPLIALLTKKLSYKNADK